MDSRTPIVSVTDFVRNFSEYVALLPRVEEIILTRDSYAVATVKATAGEKNRALLDYMETWDGSLFDMPKAWKAVAARRNRHYKINL